MTQPATQRSRREKTIPWLMTAGLVVLASALTTVLVRVPGPHPGGWWTAGLLFLAFLIGDSITLRFEVGRQSLATSISEIPLLIALFVLPPWLMVLTRLLAVTIVQVHRTRDFTKLAFNVALSTTMPAIAATIALSFEPLVVADPRAWPIAVGAVLVSSGLTVLVVSSVITLLEGGLAPRLLARGVLRSSITALTCSTIGLLLLLAVQVSRWAMLPLLVLATVFVFAYRAYARSVERHRSLEQLYELTQRVRDIRSEGELADALLGRVRDLLRAGYATLWLPGSGRFPQLLLTAQEGRDGLWDQSRVPQALRDLAVDTDATVAVGPKVGGEELREALRGSGVKDAIVVPLRSGTAVIGCLEVSDRLGDLGRFGSDDVKLLETLAAHTAVAVENSRLIDRLRFDAYHDSVTSLPNRHRMLEALAESVQVRAPGEVVAVLMFDVDGLRDVNDSLGHQAGDKLLTEVGRRLTDSAPAGGLVARVGGDEFVLSLRIGNADAAAALAQKMRRALQDPMPFGKLRLDVDTAVGIAIHPDHGSEPEVLLQRAEVATFAAKSTQAGIQVFNLGLESRSVRRLGLAGDLRRAIDSGQLEVYFQPKIAIRRREMVGVECLARWQHPTHGWVSPEDFVTVAEHTGQLGTLTDLVLREGLRRGRAWHDAGHPLSIAVNLSPRTLVDPAFPGHLEQLIAEYGLPPALLTLEITENGVLAETDRPLPTLRRLREIGVMLSVDDFGTGYSSLSYLRRLPVQEVKIDRTFVQGMATDPGDYAIVRAVVDLSRHFGLEVVAEGVESELALSQLEEIGCDVGQGFFFSRPLSYERLEAWLAARTELLAAGADGRRLRIVP